MRKGTLTTLLGSLEAGGLVYREPDSSDRRKTRLFLTSESEKYVAELMRRYHERFYRRFESVPVHDVDVQLYHLQHIVNY